jgi:hypothetical protein
MPPTYLESSAMRKLAFLVVALVILCAPPNAKADVYNIDLSGLPTVPGTGGPYIAGGTGAGGDMLIFGTLTPVYLLSGLDLPPDAIVNFGTLIVAPVATFDQYGDVGYDDPTYALNGSEPFAGSFGVTGCNIERQPGCTVIVPPTAYIPLLFDDPTSVQFSFVNGFIAPPVPESSTWAMLLIGFAGIGFITYRRNNAETGNPSPTV